MARSRSQKLPRMAISDNDRSWPIGVVPKKRTPRKRCVGTRRCSDDEAEALQTLQLGSEQSQLVTEYLRSLRSSYPGGVSSLFPVHQYLLESYCNPCSAAVSSGFILWINSSTTIDVLYKQAIRPTKAHQQNVKYIKKIAVLDGFNVCLRALHKISPV